MENISIRIENGKAIIEIDLSKELGKSESGKTIVIATTRGNVPIPGLTEDIRIGINCYKYPKRA